MVPSVTKVENDLKGYMHMLVISAKGNQSFKLDTHVDMHKFHPNLKFFLENKILSLFICAIIWFTF